MSIVTDRIKRDNLNMEDTLIRDMNVLEARVIAWMGQAQTLYNAVEPEDHQHILDLRQQLVDKLTAAVQI